MEGVKQSERKFDKSGTSGMGVDDMGEREVCDLSTYQGR